MEDLQLKEGKFGNSVFAMRPFHQGERILDFSGPLLERSAIPKNIVLPEDDRYIQVGIDLFIGPSGKIDDMINHSCEPNSAVLIKNKSAQLFSIREIREGEEITYDYSLQMNDEPWTMKCQCGSKNCRRLIREYKFLPQSLKNFYLNLGFVPEYNKKL